MPRTRLSPKRLIETKKVFIGHVIVFCEGYTERNYMDYFAKIINNRNNKYTNIKIELEIAGGNAQTVLNYAEEFLLDEENNKNYSLYKKYLVFDCDDPKDIQSVITTANESNNEYELLVSNYLFETWLLMHFENISEDLSKRNTYRNLEEHLSLKKTQYSKKKNNKGIIRQIISNGNIDNAIQYAKKLDMKYIEDGKNIFVSIMKMNPYSNVYKLIEQFMIEISE